MLLSLRRIIQTCQRPLSLSLFLYISQRLSSRILGKMVQIVGKYEHVKSEGFEEYLKAVGGPSQAEVAKVVAQSKPTLEVIEKGADEYVITVSNEGKVATNTFKLGTPYDETMPYGSVVKSVTTRVGNKFTTETDLPDGNKSVRIYEFTDAGITVRLSDKKVGAQAVRTYKRL